jgi:hypothetical protein
MSLLSIGNPPIVKVGARRRSLIKALNLFCEDLKTFELF